MLIVAAWVGWAPGLCAQGTLTTIFTNGPTSNRINIVVLSEGYQASELVTKFLGKATNAVNNLLSEAPYQAYASYFNAYAISVASAESGSDHPFSGEYKNTYFNSTYDPANGTLITIPPNFADPNSGNGQGKVDMLLANLMPEYDLAILLVNDLNYGGSGGITLISSINVALPEFIRHESGHTFAGLGDEYETSCAAPPAEYPNVTAQTNRALIKWRSWILESTPIPTAETIDYAQVVGLFQGAQCQASAWYRPKYDCKMRTLSRGFCEVCSEQIVKSMYQQVRPIESFVPASTNVTVTTTQAVAFSVTTLQPANDLSVQWYTNGVAATGATNPNYNLFPKWFTNGIHSVRAEVRDATALVRNDPTNLLSQFVAWTLNVSVSELSLISPQWLAGGRFSFSVTGIAPQGFVIQASTNLSYWTALTTTNSLTGGIFHYTNTGATNFPRRFYRTLAP